MTNSMRLKMGAYALALIGLWSVTYTEYFSFFWPLASTVLVLVGWFFEGPREYKTFYRRAWIAIGAALLLFFPFDMVFMRSLLLPAVHLSIYAQAYSLLNPKNDKVYRRMLIVSFAQILASTNLTTDLRFGIIITAFCVVGIYFVLLLYMKGAASETGGTFYDLPEAEKAAPGLLFFSLVLAICMLPLSLGFFYSMPRLRYALIARGNPIDSLERMRRARQRTGFTRTVELGTFGRVQEDQTLALRVEVPSTQGRPLNGNVRWRNGALNIYDGAAWSSSRGMFRYFDGRRWRVADKNTGMIYPQRNHLFIADGIYSGKTPEQLDADTNLLKQVFYLEIPFSDNLFAAGEIKAVQGPFSYGVGRDFNTSFSIGNRSALPDLISYTVYSYINEPTPEQLRRVSKEDFEDFTQKQNYSDYVRKSFLQLPTSLNPQIRQLALDITKDVNSPYDKIRAIRQFLETRYNYSLDLAKPMTDDPLYDFLFISRTGHCEYFATAMTVMCRCIGIPARLARGFQQGEWNETGEFYEVRQKDSHAWTEVLFPEYGWVEFDPSPRATANEYFEARRSNLARWLSKRLLQLQILWRQNVIGYNETRRLRLFGVIKDFLWAMPKYIVKTIGGIAQAIASVSLKGLVLCLVALAVLAGLFEFSRKYRIRLLLRLLPSGLSRRKTNGTAFYGKMLKLLEKRKIVKPASVTPLEFLDTPLLRRHPRFEDIEALTSLYYGARYGDRKLDDDDMAGIRIALANIRRVNGQVSPSVSRE
jgi:hypothetical protein